MIDPLIEDHRTLSERFMHLKLLHPVEKSHDPLPDCFLALDWLLGFRDTVSRVIGEERHHPLQIMARPRGTEIVNDLNVGLLSINPLNGIRAGGKGESGRDSRRSRQSRSSTEGSGRWPA